MNTHPPIPSLSVQLPLTPQDPTQILPPPGSPPLLTLPIGYPSLRGPSHTTALLGHFSSVPTLSQPVPPLGSSCLFGQSLASTPQSWPGLLRAMVDHQGENQRVFLWKKIPTVALGCLRASP